jgi:hypothetical protein
MNTYKEVNGIAKLGKTLATVTVLAVIAIGAGLLVAWFMGRHGGINIAAPSSSDPVAGATAPVATATPNPLTPPAVKYSIENRATAPQYLDSRTWEEKLEDILLHGGDANAQSDKILALMATASPDAQLELSQHLINMTQDDHYDGVAGLLTNATTQKPVSTVLMNDLLNRRNTLKLPMLLAVAENDDHPLKGEAKDLLGVFIQTDYGTNWSDWSGAVTNWLQQNEQQ